MPYRSGYRSDYSYDTGFNTGCYRCSCCGRRIVRVAEPPEVEERPPLEVVERPIVERFPVAERHWVQRDYIERRYYETRYPYSAYPRRDHYSYYYPGRGADYDAVPPGGPGRERRFGYGAEYPPPYRYVTSSRAYDYRPAYEYRPSYEYEVPRPPAPVPSGYYGPGYSE